MFQGIKARWAKRKRRIELDNARRERLEAEGICWDCAQAKPDYPNGLCAPCDMVGRL